MLIETKRLLLRPLEASDAPGMFALDSNPAVHEFLGKKPIQTIEQVQTNIAAVQEQYVRHGIGRWAIIDKATNDFIGWSGLKYEPNVRPFAYYDLGYRLREEYWGRGIATESAIPFLQYGFEELGLDVLHAGADVQNSASNRVLQKLGFRLVETFEYDGQPHYWYELTKADWL